MIIEETSSAYEIVLDTTEMTGVPLIELMHDDNLIVLCQVQAAQVIEALQKFVDTGKLY